MEQDFQQLESLLRQQIGCHEQMAELMRQKLAALRQSDPQAVQQITCTENAVLQTLGELEKRRQMLSARLTLALAPQAPAPFKLAELAQRTSEPTRGRLLVLRQQLQQRMEMVRRESAIAHQASQLLLRHMTTLVQSIGSVMTGIGVYERHGAPPRAATAVSTFSATA